MRFKADQWEELRKGAVGLFSPTANLSFIFGISGRPCYILELIMIAKPQPESVANERDLEPQSRDSTPHLKICISGELGSGKSHLAASLAKSFGTRLISMGALQRTMAKSHGMSVLEFNHHSENNLEIDAERDRMLVELAHTPETLVIDSRMAWHLLPNAAKFHLIVNPLVAAQRVVAARREGETYVDLSDAERQLRERKESENRRFKTLYGVDCDSFDNYDFIIDTTNVSEKLVFEHAEALLCASAKPAGRLWIAAKNLFPTQKITESVPLLPLGGWENTPTLAIRRHNSFFIYDGHKRVFKAISEGIAFVPVILVTSESQMYRAGISPVQYINDAFNLSRTYDWEDALGFRFAHYPSLENA